MLDVLPLHSQRVRHSILATWLLLVAGALYLYLFQREFVRSELQGALSTSMVVASILYVVLGSLRALTFVPATFLLLIAMPFFSPLLLLALTLPGIAVSSTICYFFAEALRMDELFERKYPQQIHTLKRVLQRHPISITIGWSFLLFLPTDLICYVCGSLRINYAKFIIGVLIGEGSVYAIYIYVGAWILPG
ncbi:MAG: VTT domain-containing protein [Vicinamibacterales bacterium]